MQIAAAQRFAKKLEEMAMSGKASVFRSILLIATLLLFSAVASLADSYANEGMVYVTGVINSIDNQQTCNKFGCHLGDQWTFAMGFRAQDWNAPGSNYLISTGFLNCIGGPPCIDYYKATSNFGWSPFYFDSLIIQIDDGNVVDVRAGAGNYFIEWGFADRWLYEYGFSGSTSGYAVATPEPTTLTLVVGGILGSLAKRKILTRRMV
jgi:hypothetical protein